ncbi:Hypothetical protein, putative [Bodo saltans]|uniref:Uncharacterized protein n=1 Tax=Bodo saltans TaxID=75058 RepID=A0A0S4J5L5_BODSA|nr:Hypothetical protein, putative [Bodo saltans]|eukprot:CUG77979.1 Hypothetical protein, putative [Bodo saltans]
MERIADALYNADFILVLIGPRFDDGGGLANPFESDRCDPLLVSQPNRFMGFWGGVYNTYMDRTPHEGFSVLSRWRDRYYCSDDIRKKGKKKPGGDDELSEFDRMSKCLVYTANVGNQFQRLGVPSEEVFDALGNITLWQCSRQPACCQRTALVERNFRFVIDDATKEAMPVKYLTQKPKAVTTERIVVVDSDDEELTALDGGRVKNPFEVKMIKEDQVQRQRRRMNQPRAIRHHHRTQARQARERFPDLFTGYAVESGQRPIAHAFIDSPFDENSPRKQPRPPIPTPPAAAVTTTTVDGAAAAPAEITLSQESAAVVINHLRPTFFPRGVLRCSHLFEHISALDVGTQMTNQGQFFTADPERFTKEREQMYTGLGKMFTPENPSLLSRRCKYITYNISIFISKDQNNNININSGNNKQLIIPEATREKLLTVYGKSPTMIPVISKAGGGGGSSNNSSVVNSPNNNNSNAAASTTTGGGATTTTTNNNSNGGGIETVVVGSIHPSTAAQLDLQRQLLDPWSQGYRGCYYFSNQSARQCMVDQSTDTTIDVVRVQFPAAKALRTTTAAPPPPSGGKSKSPTTTVPHLQAIDEFVSEPTDGGGASIKIAGGEGLLAATTPSVVIADADEPLELAPSSTISIMIETVIEVPLIPPPEGAKAPPPLPAGSCPTRFVNTWQLVGKLATSAFSDAEFKGKDALEYILIGRDHHGVRIGVDKSRPNVVRYMDFQCPSTKQDESLDDTHIGGQLGAAFVSHVNFIKERREVSVAPTTSSSSPAEERPPIPAPNHQLCANCHDVARPFVLMSKPGKKDEGFCHGLQAARVKQVKAWEKSMTDCLKTDNTKSIVMLELGCDRKADPVKQYSEKTFKTLKQSKCTHVRISTQDLEAKAKKGGEEGNAIVLVTNPTQALVTLDNLLGERLRTR